MVPAMPGVASDDDAVRATIIRNRSSVVQQGVIIAAVLETPLNSDRPGWLARWFRRMFADLMACAC